MPFKVIRGRWFRYQSKARVQLPISYQSQPWSYLAQFQRYCRFSVQNSDPIEFGMCSAWTRLPMLWLRGANICSYINFEIVQPIRSRYINVTDGQTGGRTDRRTDDLWQQYHALLYVHREVKTSKILLWTASKCAECRETKNNSLCMTWQFSWACST